MQSSWLFINIDELLFRGWLVLAWLWEHIAYIGTFQWVWSRPNASTQTVLDRLGELGISSREAGNVYADMLSNGLSNSEMLQVVSDVSREGLFGDTAIRAISHINPSDYVIDTSVYGDGLFRWFESRPSQEQDSIQSYLNPVGDQSLLEVLWGILFGTGDKESIISMLFGTLFGWIILCAIGAWLIIWYLKHKIAFLDEKYALTYDLAHTGYVQQQANNKAERWNRITSLVASEDENSWKIAIIDADILLDEVLSEQGFAGSTVGEKLQDARRGGKLTTIEYAGEMHGIRNKLSHQGEYVLTQREAKTGISMLEKFFNELYHL